MNLNLIKEVQVGHTYPYHTIWAAVMPWSWGVQRCLFASGNPGLNLDSFGCMMQPKAAMAPWEACSKSLVEVALQLSVKWKVKVKSGWPQGQMGRTVLLLAMAGAQRLSQLELTSHSSHCWKHSRGGHRVRFSLLKLSRKASQSSPVSWAITVCISGCDDKVCVDKGQPRHCILTLTGRAESHCELEQVGIQDSRLFGYMSQHPRCSEVLHIHPTVDMKALLLTKVRAKSPLGLTSPEHVLTLALQDKDFAMFHVFSSTGYTNRI